MATASPGPADENAERVEIAIVDGMARVDAAEWDALTTGHDPFTRHDFLLALEDSRSASAREGWMPAHVLVRRGKTLIGAAPAYVKHHSYGEYIFDWGWARASERAGVPYYPKVVSAVPFTPATGRRILVAPGEDEELVVDAVLAGLRHLCDAVEAQSFHLLFITGREHELLAGKAGLIGRTTHQYHWLNQGYGTFDDWLATFRSKSRKETRRERRKAREAADAIHVLRGPDLGDREWRALRGFYEDTTGRKWGQAYLTPAFFELAQERLQDTAMAWLAEKDGRYVAGALCFQEGDHLYGRYWGCKPGFSALHFELCYHGPIDACIQHGWSRFEAGAQGQHKIKRGLMPHPTWSAHWLRHPGLLQAVERFCQEEAEMTTLEMEALDEHGPFRRGDEGG